MVRLNHVVLHVRPEPVLRSEQRGEGDPGQRGDQVADMDKSGIDGGRVGDESHASTGEARRETC